MSLTEQFLRDCVLERLNFDQLFAFSEPKRVLRSKTVRGPNLGIESYKDSLFYFFNFKAYPSTTGQRHKGYIKFFKPEDPDTPLEKVDCVVDCDCPDYMYVYAYANAQRDAGEIGSDSINQCIDRAPRIKNPRGIPGLCKHLLALRNFLYGQDSMFPPADDPEDSPRKAALVHKAQDRMGLLAQAANGVVIDDDGNIVTGTAVPEQPAPPTPGSAAAAAASRELELRRRQQIRSQGGDPDAPEAANELPPTAPNVPNAVPPIPEEPAPQPPTNPTNEPNPTNQPNPPNPRSASNRRRPPRPEGIENRNNIVRNMDSTSIKLLQEMADAQRSSIDTPPPVPTPESPAPEGGETKTPSQQALDALQNMEKLLGELVQLNQAPPPPEPEPEPEPDMGPEEPPMDAPVPAGPSGGAGVAGSPRSNGLGGPSGAPRPGGPRPRRPAPAL